MQKERKISPYEALIVASLAQAEAGNAEDLGKVARVAYNRVYSGNIPCNCLQFDVDGQLLAASSPASRRSRPRT